MFGELVVGYLFLGGAGAGALAMSSLFDLAWVRTPFGTTARVSVDEASPAERTISFGVLAGLAALVLGALFLLFDLGRIDRVEALFLRPSATYLTVGSYALAALALLGAFLAAVRFAYLPLIARSVVRAAEALSVLVGIVVMLYTGLLLQDAAGVAFWHSPLVPVLFALSSLSCGAAVLLIAALFVEPDERVDRMARMLARIDAVVIVLEVAAAALFAGLALASAHPAESASAMRLVCGDLAAWWWVGFALCGLVVPLAVEAALFLRRRDAQVVRAAFAVAAVLVLVGGFSMRSAVVEAGAHRDLVLDEPNAQAFQLE